MKTIFVKFYRSFLCSIFILFATLILPEQSVLHAQTEVRLRAETNTFSKIPVELKPCQPKLAATSKEAQRVLDILDNDLWMSSLIASFRSDERLGGSDSPWLEVSSLGPSQPIRLVVQSQITISKNRIKLSAELLDGQSQTLLTKKNMMAVKKHFVFWCIV